MRMIHHHRSDSNSNFNSSLLLYLILSVVLLSYSWAVVAACFAGDREALLELKRGFNLTPDGSLASWVAGGNCCKWENVTCDPGSGRVTVLDLSNRKLSGNLTAAALFNLTAIQNLSLAYNHFAIENLPQQGFELLANLTHLNLSNSGIIKDVPAASISRLRKLVTLDLSSYPSYYEAGLSPLNITSLRELLGGLGNLKELYLNGVTISAAGTEWCSAVADSVPGLQKLSLSACSLSGPIDLSLGRLGSLSLLHLNQNNLSTTVPDFLGNFSNLNELLLSNCGLKGTFPGSIFRLPKVKVLDLSRNPNLHGSLPANFPVDSPLRSLKMSLTNFSGILPASIGSLKSLEELDLSLCNFFGPIPSSMKNLTKLVRLDLSLNEFNGSIPPFWRWPNLTSIVLSHNRLTGQIQSSGVHDLGSLVKCDLKNNSLDGSIPKFLLSLPALQELDLSFNQLSGFLVEFSNAPSSSLISIDLSSNMLQGPIPKSMFELSRLTVISLASNNFSDKLVLEDMLLGLKNLSNLDLSNNQLLVVETVGNLSLSVPSINTLKLVSCNLTRIPLFLKNQVAMQTLDLSDNQIAGAIPEWIWSITSTSLNYLNLSHNLFTSFQGLVNLSKSNIAIFDISSNSLQGPIPMPPPNSVIVDYSVNNFSSSIHPGVASSLNFTIFFSLSDNNLTGAIPTAICNASFLQVLDISYNKISGMIPKCLLDGGNDLGVLNLRSNELSGTLPQKFSPGCLLRTLNLNSNKLGGAVTGSLANCNKLEVLDLGNNDFSGLFPYWLGDISALTVLVLRSNRFNGQLGGPPGTPEVNDTFIRLQIFDISSNNLTGNLPSHFIGNFKGMMNRSAFSRESLPPVGFEYLQFSRMTFYQDSVSITSKGLELTLEKILTVLTYIDLSNNQFNGSIPEEMGELKSLYMLNISHNALTGSIPAEIGNLEQLESLDLSRNRLSGQIPESLASLTFLSFLNLSDNQLVGRIPQGSQLQTFSSDSFQMNTRLCGPPLPSQCPPPPVNEVSVYAKEPNWQFICIGLGFGGGLAMVVVPLTLQRKWRRSFNKWVDELFWACIFPFTVFLDFRDAKVAAEDEVHEVEEVEEPVKRFCVFCTKLDYREGNVSIHHMKCCCPEE